jgi:hypothetical protein
MPVKPLLCLMVFSATGALGSSSAFQLGVAYSEWLNFPANNSAEMATDGSGAVYFLTNTFQNNIALSTVTKLSADGKTVLWQNQLGFAASAMTVDPGGGVYVVPVRQTNDTTAYVAKLAATGTGLAWKTSVGFLPQSLPAIAADSQGRVYLAAQVMVNNFITRTADVVRLNAAGTGIDFTSQVMGTPTSIAIDQSGAAFVAGSAVNSQGVTTGWHGRLLLGLSRRLQRDRRCRRGRKCCPLRRDHRTAHRFYRRSYSQDHGRWRGGCLCS